MKSTTGTAKEKSQEAQSTTTAGAGEGGALPLKVGRCVTLLSYE